MSLRGQVLRQAMRHRGLHKLALKVYALRRPPPYLRPNMEFESDTWNGISSLHRCGGGQIGEDNTGPYPYGEVTDNLYETCRFADGRNGLPMNVSSLRWVMPHAGDAYRLTTLLRDQYIATRQLDGPRLSLVQAHLFSKFSASLPAYLARRSQNAVPDGELQPLETAFYMLGSAPFMLMRNMLGRGCLDCLDPRPMSAERLYQLSDACGVLISSRGRACPASPKLIREFFDVFMNGTFNGSRESAEVQRVLALLGDWDRFYAYGLASSRLDLLVRLNKVLAAQALLRGQRPAGASRPCEPDLRKAAVDQCLEQSHIRACGDAEVLSALDVVKEGLVVLLRDHGEEPMLDSLRSLEGSALPGAAPIAFPASTRRRIQLTSELVLQACRRNLRVVQQSLEREVGPELTTQDLLRRTGGPALQHWLASAESLEASPA